jgi:hypothetical protein
LPSLILVVSTNACLPFRLMSTASHFYRIQENLLIVKPYSEEYSGLESLERNFYLYDRNNHHKSISLKKKTLCILVSWNLSSQLNSTWLNS